MTVKDKQRRVWEGFAKDLDDIKVKRVKKGFDKEMISDARLTRGMARFPEWGLLKDRLIHMPRDPDIESLRRRKNRRGSIMDIFVWMIVALISVVFFALIFYGFGQITTSLVGLTEADTATVNVTQAAQNTFGQVYDGMAGLKFLTFVLILGLGISIFVSNFLVRSYPVFFVLHILVTVVAVIFAIQISIAYEELLRIDILGPALQEFSASSWIILNLPIWVTVIGIFGAVLLFVNMTRDSGLGGGII